MIFLPYILISHLLSIVLQLVVISCSKLHPTQEFTSYHHVKPILIGSHSQVYQLPYLKNLDCSDLKRLQLIYDNITFNIDLKINHHIIPENYFERFHLNGSSVIHQKHQLEPLKHCHFHGSLSDDPNSFAALSTFRGTLNGIIFSSNETYHVHFDNSTSSHLLFKSSQFNNTNNFKCGLSDPLDQVKTSSYLQHRAKRSINRKEPYRNNAKSRYVELVLVNDYKEFLNNKQDREAVIEKSKQIANIVNALYNQLNIFVALVGVVIWSEFDEIALNADGDITLTNFLRYRKERLVPQHPNDNAQLITGTTFNNGVVGKALKGPICTYEFSGGVNTWHSSVISLVATTVAHELGHNFGMEHDTTECTCPEEKCIMAHSSGPSSPRKWSSCSINYLNDAFARGMDHCLQNIPRSIIGPVCGNGFTEDGEECDCGLKEFCNNPCCNASTCKLKPGAQCAIGICCDLDSCSIIKEEEHKICRKAKSECDFTEYCDGKSELCPEDIIVHDGTECSSDEAYCYNGTCSSYISQCKLLWGSTGTVSAQECFNQNSEGKPSGNCGYIRTNKTYKACHKSDVLCGMLHCEHLNERLEFGMYSAAILHKTFITYKNEKVLTCQSAVIDLGLDTTDPGLVPNGAKCGENKMCLNQRCILVDRIKPHTSCPNDCSGNGICDNKGVCHCIDGFASPDCEQPLPRWYHLTLALYIIFLCILPLTAFATFIAYYFHSNIKTWWILRARKANIKSRAKQTTIIKGQHLPANIDLKSIKISGPLPLDDKTSVTTSVTATTTNVPSVSWATSVSEPNSSLPGSVANRKSSRSTNHLIKPAAQISSAPPRPVVPPPPSNFIPTRLAPPPPPPAHSANSSITPIDRHHNDSIVNKQSTSNLTRSTSLRSSSRTNLERPKHPPPKPPMDQCEDNSSTESNDSSDIVSTKNNDQCPLMNQDNTASPVESLSATQTPTASIGQANFASRLATIQASFANPSTRASHSGQISSARTKADVNINRKGKESSVITKKS